MGLLITTADGTIRSVNPVLAGLLRRDSGEVVGDRCLDHVAEADRDSEAALARRIWLGESAVVTREVQLLRPDDSPELVIASSSLVRGTAASAAVMLTQIESIGTSR